VFLVLELVDGGTLAETLAALKARGSRMPIDDVLAIARQVAEALEAAHERGVVHRDLKPANIASPPRDARRCSTSASPRRSIRPALGPVEVADLDVRRDASRSDPRHRGLHEPGTGQGPDADKRSDVWSFGCVLYEMLAGKRAFEGEDVPDTLAAVLRGEPDWTALPASLPSPVRALLEGCLKKDRRQRVGDISTALFLLDQPPVLAGPVPATAATARRPDWWLAAGLAAAIAATAALTAFLIWRSREVVVPAVTRFTMTLPAGQQFTNIARRFIAISPDGTLVAYVADQKLQVRAMADFDARTLTAGDSGTPSITLPAFSPDGPVARVLLPSSNRRSSVCPLPAALQ
jgi:serine/threonine-protein kinase